MPDNWESAHGFDPAQPDDAARDEDNDGMSNLDEYRAGTDPRDARSYLKVGRIKVTGGVVLEFQAVAERAYTIEYSDSPAAGSWLTLREVEAWPADRTGFAPCTTVRGASTAGVTILSASWEMGLSAA